MKSFVQFTKPLYEALEDQMRHLSKRYSPDVIGHFSNIAHETSAENPADFIDHLKFMLAQHERGELGTSDQDKSRATNALSAFSSNKRNLLKRNRNIRSYANFEGLERAGRSQPEDELENLHKNGELSLNTSRDMREYHGILARNHEESAAASSDQQESDAHMRAAQANREVSRGADLDLYSLSGMSKDALKASRGVGKKSNTAASEQESNPPEQKTPQAPTRQPTDTSDLLARADHLENKASIYSKTSMMHAKNLDGNLSAIYMNAETAHRQAAKAMRDLADRVQRGDYTKEHVLHAQRLVRDANQHHSNMAIIGRRQQQTSSKGPIKGFLDWLKGSKPNRDDPVRVEPPISGV